MNLRFFGRLADLLGREMRIDLPGESPSIAEVRSLLAERHPAAREQILSPRVRACVGDVIVADCHRVGAGQEIEFFPPVSGG